MIIEYQIVLIIYYTSDHSQFNLMRQKFNLILYYLIFSKLPNSAFPLGRFYNRLRISCLSRIISIGQNCKVQKAVYIGDGNNIQIGRSCQVNDNVRLDNTRIGDFVMIGRDCIFLGKMHEFQDLSTPILAQGERKVTPTIVENNVWVGARVIVLPGIRLSQGCIIGAGAVVTKNTTENGVYGGVPARLIRMRSEAI